MTAPITENIRDYLLRRGPKSVAEVASAIPDLAGDPNGEERALLLMRLDPHLERAGDNLWAARGTVLTDERKVRKAAEDYFGNLGKPGAPLSSAVAAIAEKVSLPAHRVEDLLKQIYVVRGTNIFNRPQELKGS
jgi:hypothetical protein